MVRRVRWKVHARREVGENLEITSKSYLSQQSRLLYGLLRSRRGAAHSTCTRKCVMSQVWVRARHKNPAICSASVATGWNHRWPWRDFCNGYTPEQQYDRDVHPHALPPVQHLAAERVDPFWCVGFYFWWNYYCHRTCPRGLYFNRTINLIVLNWKIP